MHEPIPRKIVEVTVSAGEQKTGGNRVGVLAFLTVRMHEMGLLRTVRVGLDVEQARIVFGQQAAFDASQPTRKGSDRHTDLAFGGHGVDAVLPQKGGHPQPFHLRAEHSANGGE